KDPILSPEGSLFRGGGSNLLRRAPSRYRPVLEFGGNSQVVQLHVLAVSTGEPWKAEGLFLAYRLHSAGRLDLEVFETRALPRQPDLPVRQLGRPNRRFPRELLDAILLGRIDGDLLYSLDHQSSEPESEQRSVNVQQPHIQRPLCRKAGLRHGWRYSVVVGYSGLFGRLGTSSSSGRKHSCRACSHAAW